MKRIFQFFSSTSVKAVEVQGYDWAVSLNRMVLDLIGLWPDEKTFAMKNSKRFRIPFILSSIILWLIIPSIYALIQVIRELPLVVDNLISTIIFLCVVLKISLLWRDRNILQEIVKMVNADWSQSIKVPWEQKVMANRARTGRIFTAFGYAMEFWGFASAILFPMTLNTNYRTINNITDPYENYVLPHQTYYPFSWGWSPMYEFLYATQVMGGSFIGTCLSVSDFLFGSLVFHACARCQILEGYSRALLDNEDYIMKLTYPQFKMELGKIVEKHLQLIKFADAIEEMFNSLGLTQVFCLSLVTCGLGFGIMTSFSNENESLPVMQTMSLVALLLNFLFNMFVYCISSETLLNCCNRFSDSLYCSCWYLLPPKYRKELLIVFVRAKYPLEFTAGKFVNLSLNTFMKILKTSAGYVSVLLALNQ